ncbi:phage recombination protein Bet [Streptomyces sp. AK08-02]|uniref:phage recombination protein Bet n=1 Tax=Streptomyces sp. AK08-02 TaxID=3028654 RepID=UPI0029B899F7|nr:phage recombination protein Bet [Streptomyces sp. AK08-02]MDX3749639.1 phage recombination protein Bet [Streptomyces sp. AK08-02]
MAETPVTWLAIREDQKAFEDQQLRALRAAFPDLVEASPAQLGIFFHYCKASGLDPFGRQIYMIKRKSRGEIRWTIQTGIDGYRLIARRAADHAGQPLAYEDFVWYDAEGGEHTVWLRDEPPAACRAVLWRGDSRFPAVAHWREYAPKVWDYESQEYKLGGLWPQMPASQLSKVAEALALRRACPADLSGLHVDEEMHAADAAESRDRVQTAAARLRTPGEKPPAQQSETSAASESAVVDAEVVESAATAEKQDQHGGQAQDQHGGQAEEAGTGVSAVPVDPQGTVEEARGTVRDAAKRLGIGFDAVNERCFDNFGISFQDASPDQLQELVESLTADSEPAETTGAVTPGGRRSAASARTRTPAKKTAAKKTTAKKATARTPSRTKSAGSTASTVK